MPKQLTNPNRKLLKSISFLVDQPGVTKPASVEIQVWIDLDEISEYRQRDLRGQAFMDQQESFSGRVTRWWKHPCRWHQPVKVWQETAECFKRLPPCDRHYEMKRLSEKEDVDAQADYEA